MEFGYFFWFHSLKKVDNTEIYPLTMEKHGSFRVKLHNLGKLNLFPLHFDWQSCAIFDFGEKNVQL